MRRLSTILFAVALVSLILRQVLLSLAILYLSFILSWKDILLWLYSFKYGIPYPHVTGRGNIAHLDLGFLSKYSIVYEVVTARHTVEDLTAEDLWRITKFYMAGIPLSEDIAITHVALKDGQDYRYYIKIDVFTDDPARAESLSSTISSFKKVVENSGLGIEPVDYDRYLDSVLSHVGLGERGIARGLVIDASLAFLTAYLLISGGYIVLLFLLPLLPLDIATTVLRSIAGNHRHVVVAKPFYSLGKNLSMEYVVDEDIVYHNARSMYTFVSTTKSLLLACSLKRLPAYTKERLGKRAYSLYELGTALDKLSLLAKSKFLYEVLDKRLRRGENIYEAALRYTASNTEALSSILDAAGLVTGPARDGGWSLYTLF